jgi:hypothetical protein
MPQNSEEPAIGYADVDGQLDGSTKRLLESTEQRLGFIPNSLLLYLHQPHLLREVVRLNNTVMRHPKSLLTEDFKYRLAFLISRNHGCQYCCAHQAHAMKTKWNVNDKRLF